MTDRNRLTRLYASPSSALLLELVNANVNVAVPLVNLQVADVPLQALDEVVLALRQLLLERCEGLRTFLVAEAVRVRRRDHLPGLARAGVVRRELHRRRRGRGARRRQRRLAVLAGEGGRAMAIAR